MSNKSFFARPRALFARLLLLVSVWLLVVACSHPVQSHAETTTLQAVAPTGFVMGTAVSNQPSALADSQYTSIAAQNFGSVTPDMAFKWGIIHPSAKTYSWTESDRALNQAEANHQLVRGHTLLWDGALPGEVRTSIKTCADARTILKDHITTVVGHYRGRIWQWDVANELFDDQGKLRDTNPFLKACGPSIVADAFRWAHAADPAAKLYLNEYSTLEPGPKTDAEYVLVRQLWSARVPINGVGFQAHLQLVTGVPSTASAQLGRYARLGLDTMITEADVRMQVPLQPAAAGDALNQQAAVYRSLLDVCLAQRRCVGFTIWGFTDKYSWVAESLPGEGNACLMDDHMQARPAWSALESRLRAGRKVTAQRSAIPSSIPS